MQARLRGFFAIAALLLGAIAATPASRADNLERFDVAAWAGAAMNLQPGGGFFECWVGTAFNNGISLIFSTNVMAADGQRRLSFLNERWELKTDSQFPLSYRIDDGPSIAATGIAGSKNVIDISLPGGDEVWTPFMHGSRLDLQAANGSFSFNLDGSGAAIRRMEVCYRQWVSKAFNATAASRDPFSAPPPAAADTTPPANASAAPGDAVSPTASAPAASAPTASSASAPAVPEAQIPADGNQADIASSQDFRRGELGREAKLFIARLMVLARRSSVFLFANKDLAQSPQAIAAAWRDGAVIGMLAVLPTKTAQDIDGIMSILGNKGDFIGECLNRPNLAIAPQPIPPALHESMLAHYDVTCDGAPPKVALRLAFLRRPAGGMYLLFLSNNSQVSATDLGLLDDQLLNAADRLVHGG
jgi:hypothetical protein